MYAVAGSEAQASYGKSVTSPGLPSFTISERHLGMGASLGNSALWIKTKGTGAIEDIFLNAVAQDLIGAFQIRYGSHARPVTSTLSDGALERPSATFSGLFPELGSRVFEIHPAYQRVRYQLASVIDVSETTFLPLGIATPGHADPPLVYVIVDLYNRDDCAHRLRAAASATLRGSTPPDVRARYDEGLRALVASNASRPELVRIVGASEKPARYGSDFDFGGTYDLSHLHAVSGDTNAVGDVIGRLQFDITLEAGQRRSFWFAIGLYANGEDDAVKHYAKAQDAASALQSTIAHLSDVLARGCVLTPDPVINHGALWSKVNMRRVMATYPTGPAFTNDPGKYANVVVRDSAWFVYGSDHFVPSFARDLLDNIGGRRYPSGKLPEYFDAVTGRIEDDGLNINDDTPLYILAVNHHFRASGDREWLVKTYPIVAAAARYIISQIDDRGLVFCSANDPAGGERAIAGWRNIIDGYAITGAVTEINAECVAALRAASHLADNLGGHEADMTDFVEASKRVRAAMDAHLINPDNGLYYLNIDVDGNAHTDVTGDEVFPVMMRACSETTGFLIMSRLNCQDFWTSAGLRTVSRLDPRFDPTACAGLMGGVWPGLTWWFAFAAARYHPEFMVRALRSSFEHYGADPRKNNTVPGQFSEWFDGESLSNRGMRLSPWEPPRFLWAAIEGVCGVMLSPGAPRINPLIPAHWTWIGLRKLPYHGRSLTYFLVREGESGYRIYSTAAVESDWGVALYHRDVSDEVRVFSKHAVVIALDRNDGIVVLIGNTGTTTIQTPVTVHNITKPDTSWLVRTYNSERKDWESIGQLTSADLKGFAVSIEAGGFRLIELSLQ
jgi:hypothetical protein